ncbi:hypothetical protein PINS_up000296 [Pythium insidiosum]|nr:hypothetical protein PINS_up000296 [Pythium insidiosum]
MSAPRHFDPARRQRVTLPTGLTMEFIVHDKTVDGATDFENVVLIMGFRQQMESWAPTVDQLLSLWTAKKNLRILTFDNRGVGGTDAPWGRYTTSQMAEDVVGLMDHLKWDHAHIAGISMGGMISLELASLAPKRVKSLSLLVTTRGKYVNEHGNGDMIRSLLARDPQVIVNSILSMLYPPEFLTRKWLTKSCQCAKLCLTSTTSASSQQHRHLLAASLAMSAPSRRTISRTIDWRRSRSRGSRSSFLAPAKTASSPVESLRRSHS